MDLGLPKAGVTHRLSRPKLFWGLAIAAATLVLGSFMSRQVAISWYSYRAKKCWWEAVNLAPTSRQGQLITEFEHARDRLVDLGFLKKRVFILKNVRLHSPDAKLFWKSVQQQFPDNYFVQLGGYETGKAELTVWERPNRIGEWVEFVSKFDVPKEVTAD
jgi:lipopolysaccharide export LptBFGC system permease protein LptF